MPALSADKIGATVDAWFREKIACGSVARDTDAHNQVSAALNDLKSRLSALAEPEAPAVPDASANKDQE